MSLAYRRDIDGLRGIAVLAVVAFHAFPGLLPGGFAGVSVFFVISGYLISRIVLEDLTARTFTVAGFYRRRIIRIFPALIVVLAACAVFGWVALLPDEYQALGKHIAGGAGFASNLVALGESGYFDHAAETKPLLHLWSLGIEEQFYIAWPLLLVLAARRRWNALPVIGAVGALSLGLGYWWSRRDPTLGFYSPLSRVWELMIGGALAYVMTRRQGSGKAPGHLQSWAGAALLVAAFLLVDSARSPRAYWTAAVLTTPGAFLLIGAGERAWLNRAVLSNRALVQAGLFSYPLYLWHWPLLSFSRVVESQKPAISTRIAMVGMAIALAWLTFRYVEQPLRLGPRRAWRAAALGAGMLVAGIGGFVIYSQDGFELRFARSQYSWSPAVGAQFAGADWKYATNAACLARYPFADAASYGWWFCMLSQDRSPTVAILGSSYANQLYPGLASHPALDHHAFLSIGTCHPVDAAPPDGPAEPRQDPCSGDGARRQQQFIDGLLAATPTITHVILDGLYDEPSPDYQTRLATRIASFERAGITVLIFEPHVKPGHDIRRCFSRPLRHASPGCEVGEAEPGRVRRSFQPLVEAIRGSHPGVAFFPQNDVFCPEGRCLMVVDGMPLYRDEYQHVSEFGSRLVADEFVEWARRNAPELLSRDR